MVDRTYYIYFIISLVLVQMPDTSTVTQEEQQEICYINGVFLHRLEISQQIEEVLRRLNTWYKPGSTGGQIVKINCISRYNSCKTNVTYQYKNHEL